MGVNELLHIILTDLYIIIGFIAFLTLYTKYYVNKDKNLDQYSNGFLWLLMILGLISFVFISYAILGLHLDILNGILDGLRGKIDQRSFSILIGNIFNLFIVFKVSIFLGTKLGYKKVMETLIGISKNDNIEKKKDGKNKKNTTK